MAQAVVIGAGPAGLMAAEQLAAGASVVLGPANDGGYGLVATRCNPVPHRLFDGLAWGTSSVLAQTRRRARELSLKTVLLGEIWDVDRPADVIRLMADYPEITEAAGLRSASRSSF